MGPVPVLSAAEEKYLEDWIIDKAKNSFPMHKDEVKDAVYNVMKETGKKNPFTNNRPGEKWVSLFLKRHPLITQRNAEVISKSKACLTEENNREWFQELQYYLEEENSSDILLNGDRIYNADGTGVECCSKSGKVICPKNYRDLYTIAPGKKKESITVLAIFSASEKKVPPMIVFPYQRIPRDVIDSVPPDYFIGRSDSGWMVAATFYEYVANCFYPWLIENGIKFPILFLVDGHKSHINLELSKFCSEKRILLFSFLPNATNVLQPCDVGVFRPLKASWRASVRRWKQKDMKTSSKGNFAPIFKEAFDIAVDALKIQHAFKKCGIFPFNIENMDFNKCMQHRHKELMNKKAVEQNSCSKNNNALFPQTLESELPSDMLESFNTILADNSGLMISNIKEPVLFSIWKKYTLKGRHTVTSTCAIEEEKNGDIDETNSDILFIEETPDPINNNQSEELANQSNSSTEILPGNNQQEKNSFQSQIFRCNSPCHSKTSTSDHLPEKTSKSIAVTPEEIWKDHLHWPNIAEKHEGKPTRKKKKIPFAISSEKWQKYKEVEKAQKENKEKIIKRKRESMKEKKIEKVKKIKKTNKKVKKTEEWETSSDDTVITMHDSDSSLGNLEDLLHPDGSDSESQNICLPFLRNIKINQTYVIIEYEKEFFPGLVTNKKGKKYEVNTMTICEPQRLNWKWPEVEDKIWYFQDKIKEIIRAPELVSATSSRFSGVYKVPEIEKYRT